MKKTIAYLLCSTVLAMPALAGLSDAITAYDQKKYETAFEEFSYLADQNNNIASYYLGQMYEKGNGVPQSNETAAKHYLASYNAGNTRAASGLGRLLIKGEGIEKNVEEGLRILKTAGRAGDKEALYELGEIYASGTDVERDYVSAAGFYQIAAAQGYAPAQYKLAILYLYGRGVPQDYALTITQMSRAAHQGYLSAQRDLAELLSTEPRLINIVEAYAWYSIIAAYNTDEVGTSAAERRDAIGLTINDMENLQIAQQMARTWAPVEGLATVPPEERTMTPPIIYGFNDDNTLRELQEQNEAVLLDGSKYGILSDMLEASILKQDTSAIEEKIQTVASNGQPDAFTYWGKVVENRLQDPKKALDWFQKGAQGGDAEAQFYVAKAYCEGEIIDADMATCYMWLQLALKNAEGGFKTVVQTTSDAVEAILTPEQKEQATKKIADAEETARKKEPKKMFKLF